MSSRARVQPYAAHPDYIRPGSLVLVWLGKNRRWVVDGEHLAAEDAPKPVWG